jgi:Co/Zn/Cd efflux system component
MACCSDSACSSAADPGALNSPRWRRALWIALIVNAGFFVTEIVAGAAAGSAALQADALDFFGDAANYAISLGVAGMALSWRARAAAGKGGTLILFALWVLGNTAWHAVHGTLPHAEIMGVVGVAALIANGGVALLLYRFRTGDANMRSVCRDYGWPWCVGRMADCWPGARRTSRDTGCATRCRGGVSKFAVCDESAGDTASGAQA